MDPRGLSSLNKMLCGCPEIAPPGEPWGFCNCGAGPAAFSGKGALCKGGSLTSAACRDGSAWEIYFFKTSALSGQGTKQTYCKQCIRILTHAIELGFPLRWDLNLRPFDLELSVLTIITLCFSMDMIHIQPTVLSKSLVMPRPLSSVTR